MCYVGLQLVEINISYDFGDIKAINLLCQQPPAQFIVTLRRNIHQYVESIKTYIQDDTYSINKLILGNLIPRPLPDFILQL